MRSLRIAKILFFFAALTGLSSCFVQTMNSVNGDAKAFQPLPANSNAAFSAVHAIIQKNCATCHSNFASFAEADFVSNKLVQPGSPADSEIFQNLKGSGAGSGEMPKDAAPLPASDINAFRAWITNMVNIAPTVPATLFARSQIVINNSCVGCHKEVSGLKEADFVTIGWVVPGNAESSKLFYKLIGTDVPGELPGDMPLKGNPVSPDDLETLRQWINQMTPANFPAPITPGDTAFGKVQKIIGDNCLKCHSGFGNYAESDFVTKGLVSPGNAAGSKLYTQLIGSLPSSSASDMPKAGAPLTKDQLQDVVEWINGIKK
jgi:mono/diheme cytochrome c family protein